MKAKVSKVHVGTRDRILEERVQSNGTERSTTYCC